MAYFGKKAYGEYKTEKCVFCGAQSYAKNKDGFPVCNEHKKQQGAPELKCLCGEWLDIRTGKFGAYGKCIRCGNVNLSKAMAVAPPPKSTASQSSNSASVASQPFKVIEKKPSSPQPAYTDKHIEQDWGVR